MTQLFRVTVAALTTNDDCECVPSASYNTTDLAKAGNKLSDFGAAVAKLAFDMPFENIRPMTTEEANAWVAEQDA